MESDLISICIPCYEMGGKGAHRLDQLLQTIYNQNLDSLNLEVVISDHSLNNDIENLLNGKYSNRNINYNKNTKNRGSSSSNINNALDHANGDYIKIMFQDDFFVNKNALKIISSEKRPWLVCGCVHSNEDEHVFFHHLIPKWHGGIIEGINTIGGPSCLYFKKTDIRFDERLLWFMDVDFYYKLFLKYGEPYIITNPLYCSRLSSAMVSKSLVTNEIIEKETLLVKKEYGI